jgi:molybdopterin-binding protein
MKFSARNQLRGSIEDVHHGVVTTTVRIRVADGLALTSSITKEAAEDLGLSVGDEVTALIKSSDVIVAIDH